jgi:predicted nucleic acid-binding Zn ribbon protein
MRQSIEQLCSEKIIEIEEKRLRKKVAKKLLY